MQRGNVLDEAKTIINGYRQDTYGNPEDSFHTIGEMWNSYINAKYPGNNSSITAKDVALMMTLFKIVREAGQGKKDNLVDAAGYIGIAGDFYNEEEPHKTAAPSSFIKQDEFQTLQKTYDRFVEEEVVNYG